MTEVSKQWIITEYKASPELTEFVLGQFDEDYQNSKGRMKAKILAADLDPQLLDSSDEESEAEGDPPIPPITTCTFLLFFFFFIVELVKTPRCTKIGM